MTMKKVFLFSLVILIAGFTLALTQEEAGKEAVEEKSSVDLAGGESIYKAKCAFCHGDEGDGQGPSGKFLKPPPGNFTDQEWIHGGEIDDIAKTIKEGVSGTAMVGFANALTEDEIRSIAAYVKQFSGEAEEADESSEK